ncbi:phospholipase D-like domain-containing protein [Nocardioides houyundeii]|uniref:phospholipase D-like domain-containing protein n=1 Tax=Nocardioides houyundeii TaxID=2045452 RepID=UPI000C761021|nr:phospholipase D-like domain-containing protein [Nocardioides houyundeii]
MRKSFVVALLSVALMVSATLGLGSPALAKPAKPAPDNFVPKSGPAFNDPYGKPQEVRRLIRQVNRTIDSVPKKQKIRIASWNVRSSSIVTSLIRAHQERKISVQVVMDRHNYNPNNPNADARRLIEGLKKGNKQRPKEMRSWVRKCISACRGKSGIAHTKFFLFSKVVKVPDVIMYGSYNATELGATIQWNDLYTIKRDTARYATFEKVFKQMARQKTVKQGLVGYTDGVIANGFYPFRGEGAVGDPVIDILKQVSCTGAATKNGRTRIRIAQTAMYGDRGIKIAKKLASLRKQGCNIRIVYAMFGNNVLKILRQAGVPLTHLAYDSNKDGVYDRYVHMKAMAISGNYGGNPAAKFTLNGSANWTPVALASDEVLGQVYKGGVTTKYMKWIDYMFTHRPKAWGADPNTPGKAAGRRALPGNDTTLIEGVDPYALIKEEN